MNFPCLWELHKENPASITFFLVCKWHLQSWLLVKTMRRWKRLSQDKGRTNLAKNYQMTTLSTRSMHFDGQYLLTLKAIYSKYFIREYAKQFPGFAYTQLWENYANRLHIQFHWAAVFYVSAVFRYIHIVHIYIVLHEDKKRATHMIILS